MLRLSAVAMDVRVLMAGVFGAAGRHHVLGW